MTSVIALPTPEEARAHPCAWGMLASAEAVYGAEAEALGVEEGTLVPRWEPADLHWYLAEQFLRVSRGEVPRLAVSVPPQHGKTEELSVLSPPWHLGNHPRDRVLQISYGADLTVEWTGRGRDLFARHGPEVFGLTTWERSKRAAWDVYDESGRRTGGSCRGVGVGGAVPGRPGDLVIVDDPNKGQEQAESPTERERLWKWIVSSVFPRARRLLLVATRWHEDDVIGRLLERQRRGELGEPWVFVNLPAVAEEGDPLGRAPGEVLWPGNPQARGDADWYRRKRIDVGPYVWSALYQGRPSPLEGGMFKREWLQRYDAPPEGLVTFATVDLATSKRQTADHTVCSVWGVTEGWDRCYLLEVVRGRFEGPEIAPMLRDVQATRRVRAFFLLATGHLAIVQLCRQAGLPVRAVQEQGDKVARALAATAELQAGRILLPRSAPWLEVFERELLRFGPGSDEDDQVDTLSACAALLLEHRRAASELPQTSDYGERRGRWRIGR